MLDINSSIQKNGTLKQVAYLSATISESGTVSMSASFNDFAAYLANDTALDSELKSFLDGVKSTYKATYSTEDNTISSDVNVTGTVESEVFQYD